jgi:PAS domain S-box-containing protein
MGKTRANTEDIRAYREMFENIREVFFLWDAKTLAMLYVSPAYEVIWGRSQESIYEDAGSYLRSIHPDDRKRILKRLKSFLEGEKMVEEEYRILMPDGTTRWIRGRTFPVHDENGEVYRVAGIADDITTQKHRESLLNEAQKIAHVGAWEYDLITGKIFWTEEVYRIHELPLDFHIDFGTIMLYYMPESRTKLLDAITRAIENKESYDLELKFKSEKGRELWVKAIGKPIISKGKVVKLCGAFQDITQTKDALSRLRESEKKLNEAQELAHLSSWEHDLVTGEISWSGETFRQFGMPADATVPGFGEFIKMIHPDDIPLMKENFESAINEGKPYEMETRNILPDGSVRYYLAKCKPVSVNGKVVKLMGTGLDITAIKHTELELIRAKEEAEYAGRIKHQFLSTMSHEIRTPMNAVIGMTHLLLQEDPKPEQTENLNTLKFASENLLVLINDILDYSKIEEGKIVFEKIDFNLKDLINSIKNSHRFSAEEKEINLRITMDAAIPDIIVGDPVRISQILNNLVGNAIKFTEKGKVNVNMELLSEINGHVTVKFDISDTGIGIAQDKLEAIFERFTQASSEITRNFGGTGLGLAICKKLLLLQGSDLYVKSEVGKGTTFYFSLSFEKSMVRRISPSVNLKDIDPSRLEGISVLMAEDNAINRLVAGKFLSKWGILLDHAENGLVAWNMVKKKRYDVVLMDLQMPEMDGYTATMKIRQEDDPWLKKMPIIALTASIMIEIQGRAHEAGMSDFVTKPINPNELCEKLIKNLVFTDSL